MNNFLRVKIMSKKDELIKLTKDIAYHMKGMIKAISEQDIHSYEHHDLESDNLDDKFDYIAGDKLPAIEQLTEAFIASHGCGEEKILEFLEASDTSNAVRCLGIYELASIDAINQLFQ